MARFVAIDLSTLPPIDAVIPPVATDIIAARKQALVDGITDPVLSATVQAVLKLESAVITKTVEADSYRELIVLERVNEAVRAVLLPTAAGNDLDNLCARLDVKRLTLQAATATTQAVMEADSDLRYRYQLAPNAFSTAGPYGAYEYIARSSHPEVVDAGIYGPETGLVTPGQALTVVLGRNGDGTPSIDCLNAVTAALSDQDARPLTDQSLVRGAKITPYAIHVHLVINPGPDPDLISSLALARLWAYACAVAQQPQAYAASQAAGYTDTFANWLLLAPPSGPTRTKVGGGATLGAIYACANFDLVNITACQILSPPADVNPGLDGAVYCTNVIVDYEVAS